MLDIRLPILHVFADASQCGHNGRCAGAWVLGRGGPVFHLVLDCKSSFAAELLTMIAGLEAARLQRLPGQRIVVHTDIAQIYKVLQRARRGPAAKLRWLLGQAEAKIVADAWNFPEYQQCHHRARVEAGCYGERHPLRTMSQ